MVLRLALARCLEELVTLLVGEGVIAGILDFFQYDIQFLLADSIRRGGGTLALRRLGRLL